jgi:hypothetical protein
VRRRVLLSLCLFGLLIPTTALAAAPPAEYETFLRGYDLPHAHEVVVDDQGNVFLLAATYTDGVHLDVLVIKIDALGHEAWTRLIAASDHDQAEDLALDSDGNVWVVGWTDSPDFPVMNALDETLTGFRDVFLMKLDATDGDILYSTFLGGDYVDMGSGIAIDADDAIYLTGVAGSTDFPTTPDAYQGQPSFPLYVYQDAFVAKLSPDGQTILYSTYFGGTEDDWGDRIGLDGQGNIVLAGRTTATDLPLVDAIDGDPNQMFVSKLSADGSTLLFSSYLGGSDSDRPSDMFVDSSGEVVLAGSTQSVDYPTTPGVFQETFVGGIDACEVPFGGTFNCSDFFVTRLSTNGAGLIWSTFVGGTTVDQPRAVTLDAAGNAYVIGYTSSSDFPQAPQDELGAEIVLCRLGDEGRSLDYALGIASGSANRGNGIALDGEGSIYITGTVGVPASIYVSKRSGGSAAITGVEDGPVSGRLVLDRNHPNPFNPATVIRYELPHRADAVTVDLAVFDAAGRRVRQLIDGRQTPGPHAVTWHGRDDTGARVSGGVYFYRLRAGSQSRTRSMVLLK